MSFPPYSLRPLYPKMVGTLARLSLRGDQDPMRVFERTSQVAGALNLCLVGFLAILPLVYFRAWFAGPDAIVLGVILLNVIHIGVLQTSPFFMLDIPTYVTFSVAAGAFFSGRFAVLCVAAALGVLIKEIVVAVCIPFFVFYSVTAYLSDQQQRTAA